MTQLMGKSLVFFALANLAVAMVVVSANPDPTTAQSPIPTDIFGHHRRHHGGGHHGHHHNLSPALAPTPTPGVPTDIFGHHRRHHGGGHHGHHHNLSPAPAPAPTPGAPSNFLFGHHHGARGGHHHSLSPVPAPSSPFVSGGAPTTSFGLLGGFSLILLSVFWNWNWNY